MSLVVASSITKWVGTLEVGNFLHDSMVRASLVVTRVQRDRLVHPWRVGVTFERALL